MMEKDKDGIISKRDIREKFEKMGSIKYEKEIDEMVGEDNGKIKFKKIIKLLDGRMYGGYDDDEVVIDDLK